MKVKSVSIIVPTYNGLESLKQCLDSIKQAKLPARMIETVVVDDGSTDNTAREVRERFRDVKVHRNASRMGFIRAVNTGVKASRGSVLVLLNNDTRVDSDWLTALIESLSPSKGIVCSCSHIVNWDGSRAELAGRDIDAFGLEFNNANVPSTSFTSTNSPMLFASGGSMAILRRAYQDLGGFDPDFVMYHEDVDFGWRLWSRGYKVMYCKNSIVYHKGGSSSKLLDVRHQEQLRMYQIRNLLYTIIKNSDKQNLNLLLPSIIAFLNHHALRRMQFRSIAEATIEVSVRLRQVLGKRAKIQARRTKPDSRIFAETGHPFQFLLNSKYMSSSELTWSREGGLEQRIRQLLFDSLAREVAMTKDYMLMKDPLGSLLAVYYSRNDLTAAFPEVRVGNYERLRQWATFNYDGIPVLEKFHSWYPAATDPISALLSVYYARKDLQVAFPEVKSGHYYNLIRWATSFAEADEWSNDVLAKHMQWFQSHGNVLFKAMESYSDLKRLVSTGSMVLRDEGVGSLSKKTLEKITAPEVSPQQPTQKETLTRKTRSKTN